MYTYYCDCCGNVFDNPTRKGWFLIDGRDEDDTDGTCPKCDSPDFELIKPEEDDDFDIPDYLHPSIPLDSGLFTANA